MTVRKKRPKRLASAAAASASAAAVIAALARHQNAEKAAFFPRFFKAGPGEYAEGDQFIGVTVPLQRKVAREFKELPLAALAKLLDSPVHEHRLTSLLIMCLQFRAHSKTLVKNKAAKKQPSADRAKLRQSAERAQAGLYQLFLEKRDRVNNWDLVDTAAPVIVGEYLLAHSELRTCLAALAQSRALWDRRIAMLATLAFTRTQQFEPAIQIAELLINDEHDLIHKAVGWMLREVGERAPSVERRFLDQHAQTMPRTALRYAIEKFEATERAHYMARRRHRESPASPFT